MADSTILVVGGAGYIGSHVMLALADAGYRAVAFDNLSRGHADAVGAAELVVGELADAEALRAVFRKHDISVVMHFAAFAYIAESVQRPDIYWRNNVASSLVLLDVMREAGVQDLVFSSTCATYGEPEFLPVTEEHPQRPINPYGRSKLAVEQALADWGSAFGLRSVIFRYFNAAGADPQLRAGERHDPEPHLIPSLLRAAARGEPAVMLGDDYPTPDGTCVRDYVHVSDLAHAHLLGAERLLRGVGGGVFNLSNARGYSVREVMDSVERVTGLRLDRRVAPRRPGDPSVLVGRAERATRELGWHPRWSELDQMVETAWRHYRRPSSAT